MKKTAVTIVGTKLEDSLIRQAAEIVKSTGVEGLEIRNLHLGRAVDIIVQGENSALSQLLLQKLQNLGSYDIFVQADDVFRKKRLLVADMDATMVEGETLDELADHLGIKDKIAPITARAMRGELDFHEALRQRIKLLKGLSVSAIFETVDKMRYAQGAESLIRGMNRNGAKCILISGGFDFFTRRAADHLGFWKNFGNTLEISDDRLTGEVIPPIVDKDVKKNTLKDEAAKLNIDPRHVMAVGDGANDIPMLQAAGVGVGYFGKPAVQAATPFQIRHTDLMAMFYMQGYAISEA